MAKKVKNNENLDKASKESNSSLTTLKNEIFEWAKAAFFAIIFFIILNIFLFPAKVDGGSMLPNYVDGDRLLVSRLAYTNSLPKYGDVVIFYSETKRYTLIKRVIGLPGDQIEIKDGKVFRNGTKLDESDYINIETNGDMNVIVEAGHVFVLGDNRPDSADSRYAEVGQVDIAEIKGKVIFRIFPNFGPII